MKKLHWLIFKSFIGPFLASFSVVLFILVLQFLQRYQNDLFGKGLGAEVITQVFLYASVQLALLAAPIGILLSSLSTMGNLGESYELAAMKASGISLFRIIRPLVVITLMVTGLCFYLSWYVVPKANLKLYSLLFSAQQTKPQFALSPGYFDNKFDGYSLYFSSRSPNGRLYNIKIWDHTKSPAKSSLIFADSADVSIDNKLLYLRLNLYSGQQHEPNAQESAESSKSNYARFIFDTLNYKLDLSGFGLKGTEENAFKSHQYMLTMPEISKAIDSLEKQPTLTLDNFYKHADNYLRFEYRKPMIYKNLSSASKTTNPIIDFFPVNKAYDIYTNAQNNIRAIKSFADYTRSTYDEQSEQTRKFQIELHLKWAMPLMCLVMLFIGAPLGAIIRKGGIGMPTVISLLFFIFYYIIMTQGRKLARENVVDVWLGVWGAMLILTPIALYVTYQSATDAKLLDKSVWLAYWDKLKFNKNKKGA